MEALGIHIVTGLIWGAIVACSSWSDGKLPALKLGVQVAIFMSMISVGCEAIRPLGDSECRPAGPAIYNDC